ncbi:MAG TPA: metallophosphoesterase [Polyangiaceae bacterium]|jgi:3',5'-cyclic AMP phosphodiesterase CpdA
MRIAHLSDMHLLERTERHALAARFVSLGRRLDADGRLDKARAAVAHARAAGAGHFLFTGDLTETGTAAQFEALAGFLAECKLRSEDVTLVPGNHDAYTSATGWRDALEGPLRPWARHAALEPGKIVDLGETFILPLDATFHQPVTRSAGRYTDELRVAVERAASDAAFTRLLIAIHHPPHPRPGPWQWIDGLLGCGQLLDLIAEREHVTVAHGHLHRAATRIHGRARVIGAAAVVDGALPELLGEQSASAMVA